MHKTPGTAERATLRPHFAGLNTRFFKTIGMAGIIFSLIGLLFAGNFGISLIAIALAIAISCRFGRRFASATVVILLAMLAIWMMLMPAHHLLAASLAIFLAAVSVLALDAAISPAIMFRGRFIEASKFDA